MEVDGKGSPWRHCRLVTSHHATWSCLLSVGNALSTANLLLYFRLINMAKTLTLDVFNKQKEQTLSSVDLSRKGSIDEHIVELVDFINTSKEYFTTSSCSGRTIIFEEVHLFLNLWYQFIILILKIRNVGGSIDSRPGDNQHRGDRLCWSWGGGVDKRSMWRRSTVYFHFRVKRWLPLLILRGGCRSTIHLEEDQQSTFTFAWKGNRLLEGGELTPARHFVRSWPLVPC